MSDTSRGMLYMTISCIIMGCLWALVRAAGENLHPFLIVFYRNFFGLVMMLPMIYRAGWSAYKTPHWKLHLGRGATALMGTYGIFYAITQAPLATVVAITYAAPIFAAVGAVFILKERIYIRRIISILVGFIGVIMVLAPGLTGQQMDAISSSGLWAAVMGAVAISIAIILIKFLVGAEDTKVIVTAPFMIITPISFVVALPYWQWLTINELGMMALIGIGISIAQYLLTLSFKLADATAVLPLDFIRLLLATGFGVWLFNEPADYMVILGAVVILASTVYNSHREAVLAKRPVPAPKTDTSL